MTTLADLTIGKAKKHLDDGGEFRFGSYVAEAHEKRPGSYVMCNVADGGIAGAPSFGHLQSLMAQVSDEEERWEAV